MIPAQWRRFAVACLLLGDAGDLLTASICSFAFSMNLEI